MKEKPIIFSGPMVRAILEGRKTQTRRVIKPQPTWIERGVMMWKRKVGMVHAHKLPYRIGDMLYVRECFRLYDGEHDPKPKMSIEYRADGDPISKMKDLRWKPSIHMPKWAARIWLEITGVKVERVQDIAPSDCEGEGVTGETHPSPVRGLPYEEYRNSDGLVYTTPKLAFEALWDSINNNRPGCSWDENPWVWVIEFKRIEKD